MCTRPITRIERDGSEVTFACRSCDECIATRRHGWVARAMCELATSSHAACITLTYSDATQQSRDGAALFAYCDVSDFFKRVRSAARREAKKANWNIVPEIRFLCAGEQGDRNGRCHWHIIIYSNFDLSRLGRFRLCGKLVSHRRDMITEGKRKRRLNWTLWPHGFMTLQEPDQSAMNYVLSYCLKDQFTEEKSHNTMREAKSENFATGLFRMSKYPPIGDEWLWRKLEALDATGSVLPHTNLKIPGFSGFWHPNGPTREKLLWGLVALNQRALWATGAPAPQWPSLLASCAEADKDMDILNGKKIEDPDDKSDIPQEIRARQIDREFKERDRAEAFRRDWVVGCQKCLAYPANDWLWRPFGSVELHHHKGGEGTYYSYTSAKGVDGIWQTQIDVRSGNSDCRCEICGTRHRILAFPNDGQREERARRNAERFGETT